MKRVNLDIPSCDQCVMKGESLLCSLSHSSKTILTDGKGGNFYKKGQVIFYEGNHVNGLYCIYNGKVKLSKMGENGKEQIVRFANSGEIFGYRSLLSNESYHATATAMVDSWVCVISKERFREAMEKDTKLSIGVLQLLSGDLKHAEQQLLNVSQKSVRERMAEALVFLEQRFGCLEDQQTLDISLMRSELADIAGTTTESAIRTLAQMNDEGLIKLSGKKIKIIDRNQLIHLAGIQD